MTLQVRTRPTTAISVMKRTPFARGFKDAQKGNPFDPEVYRDGKEQWDYERGRQLGVIFSGPLKVKRQINAGAILAFVGALQQKEII